MSEGKRPVVAFLGPLGTYSHEAAYNYFGDKAEYRPESTITKVFSSLSSTVLYACLPFANSTHGSVIQTLDLLRLERWSQDAFIRGEITIKIQHCLVVASNAGNGTRTAANESTNGIGSSWKDTLKSIKQVYSHEQALGQCSAWLDLHLPGAARIRTESTALAAQRLLEESEQADTTEDRGCSAAICSEVCVSTYPGLKLVRKGIQDRNDNETRFIITSIDSRLEVPTVHRNPSHSSRIFIRIAPHESRLERAFSALLSNIVSKGLSLQRIDRRPKASGKLWEDVYFVEVVGTGDDTAALEGIWKGILAGLTSHMEVTTLGLW